MRASLLTLCALALATSAACFDWDGLVARCQDAGNCRAPGGDAGDAGDGGDGGSDSGSDGGNDAGGDGGQLGDAGASRGQPCGASQDCVSRACSPGGFCVCVFNGPCRGDLDCCQGQTCTISAPPGTGTCTTDIATPCSGLGAGCSGGANLCCSTCNPTSMMCDCSPNAFPCTTQSDCCGGGNAQCSPGKFCCEPPGTTGCTMDEQCCSRVCRGNICQ